MHFYPWHRQVNLHYQTPEEEIFAYETAIKLWNTFLYDGNFLFYHSHIADIDRRLAQKHALLEK